MGLIWSLKPVHDNVAQGLEINNKRNSFSHSVIFRMSLAYENDQDCNFVSSLFISQQTESVPGI